MLEKSVHKDNRTENYVMQTVRRHPVLSKHRVSQYRPGCNSPTPIIKVQNSLRGFSLNAQLLSIIICRYLIIIFTDSFIHLVVCLTTVPKPLPKRALHIVRSRASSFKWEYPLLSLRSTNSFLVFFLVFLSLLSPLVSFLQ